MTLREYLRLNPGVTVSEIGKWLVEWHRGRATRYENFYVAQKAAASECAYCDGSQPHRIFEINEAAPQPRQKTLSKSYLRMVRDA